MDTSNIITLFIFGAVQLISLGGIIISNKLDTRILGLRVDSLADEMKKLSKVLVNQTEQTGRINLVEERQLAQGKRLDETSARISRHIDNCNDRERKG